MKNIQCRQHNAIKSLTGVVTNETKLACWMKDSYHSQQEMITNNCIYNVISYYRNNGLLTQFYSDNIIIINMSYIDEKTAENLDMKFIEGR